MLRSPLRSMEVQSSNHANLSSETFQTQALKLGWLQIVLLQKLIQESQSASVKDKAEQCNYLNSRALGKMGRVELYAFLMNRSFSIQKIEYKIFREKIHAT